MRRLILAVLLLAGAARADDMRPAARDKFNEGLIAYEAKRYPEAIAAFREAYMSDPRPDILFAWAQAERLSGNCEGATPLYRKLLEQSQGDAQRAAVRELLDKCEAERAAAPAAAIAVVAPPPAERETPPFYTDALGDTLVGAGIVAAGTGVTLFVLAGKAHDDAMASRTYDEFSAGLSTANNRRLFGSIALAAGVGLTTAGVLRWVLRPAPREEIPKVTFFRSDGATFVALTGDL
ncbi:MAG TPA: hypothetical protein VKE22_11915 [Haliangiales bacterium]|nr:hypothetical protein [Haliangiales bacterium]